MDEEKHSNSTIPTESEFNGLSASTSTSSSSSSASASAPAPASASSSSSSSVVAFPYSLSNLLRLPMVDELVRLVANFLWPFLEYPHLEIEGKLGRCADNGSPSNFIDLPFVHTLITLDPTEFPHRFASGLAMDQFKHLNERILKPRYIVEKNESAISMRQPEFSFHLIEQVDKFFEDRSGDRAKRVRASYAIVNGKENPIPFAVVRKHTLASLDFYNGLRDRQKQRNSLDFRISANNEEPLTPNELDSLLAAGQLRLGGQRKKNRLSYVYELWNIDMTLVKQAETAAQIAAAASGDRKLQAEYEVECELNDIVTLKEEARKKFHQQPSMLFEMIAAFIDQMKTLAKYSLPHNEPPEICTSSATATAATSRTMPTASARPIRPSSSPTLNSSASSSSRPAKRPRE